MKLVGKALKKKEKRTVQKVRISVGVGIEGGSRSEGWAEPTLGSRITRRRSAFITVSGHSADFTK